MKLTFKPAVFIEKVVEDIVNTLNECEGVKASSQFIMTVPRHYLITIEVDDKETPDNILQLGALIGALDKY